MLLHLSSRRRSRSANPAALDRACPPNFSHASAQFAAVRSDNRNAVAESVDCHAEALAKSTDERHVLRPVKSIFFQNDLFPAASSAALA